MPPHERFIAWQNCHAFVLALYKATAEWPAHERYGLIAQSRRAAVSSGTNIAEGSAKRGSKEFARYLDIVNGSLAEVGYLLRLARDLEYLTEREWGHLEALRDKAARAVWGLYDAVRRRTTRP